jgi:hypothetical protein
MAMRMVHVRYMRMRVPQRLVTMPVTVRTGRHWVMRVFMVAVVMTVRVFVLRRFVFMPVTM